MFYGCKLLKSINLSNFDTSQVTDMRAMFTSCTNLTLLDISSFNTSLVTSMNNLFDECSSLSSLNLSHFNTSKVTDISFMFKDCAKLTSLNLSNFDISQVIKSEALFARCKSLKQLDISNFNFSSINSYPNMFFGCSSLKYLNICSFEIRENLHNKITFKDLFYGIANHVVFCLNNNKTRNLLYYPNQIFICEDKCYDEIIIFDTTYNNYDYTTNKIEQNIDTTYNNVYTTSKINDENNIDTTYNNVYTTSKINDENNIGTTYKNVDTTITINDENNINTVYSFNEDKTDPDTISNSQIAYPTFDNYSSRSSSHISKNNNIFDTILNSLSLSQDENLIDQSIMTISSHKSDIAKESELNFDNNTHLYNIIIDNILSQYSPNEGKSMVFEGEENTTFQITSLKNELELLKNRSNNVEGLSIIDLGQCEATLRTIYHINPNDSLIIIKREIKSNKASEKSVKYDVYEPYNKTKLNLSYCDETSIKLYVPIVLSEETRQMYEEAKKSGYNIFNKNDPFYNDICTPYDSSSGTDILLSDRMDYIFNNADMQCQSNCKLSNFNIELQYLECDCSTNDEIVFENKKNKKFKQKKFYIIFYDVLRYSNYEELKCYKLVLSVNVVTKNIGSIFVILCFIIYLICLIHYAVRKLIPLRNQLENKLKKLNSEYENVKEKFVALFYPPKKKRKSSVKLMDSNMSKLKFKKIQSKPQNITRNPKKSKDSIKIFSGSRNSKNIIVNLNFNKTDKIPLNNKVKQTDSEGDKRFQKLSDFELNELEYNEATKIDKRNLCQTYWAKLKRENLILFTFFSCNDFNLISIKISRFIFLVVGDMAFNVFFFTDESMHKLFLSYGKYDFVQQVPQMIYSIILSQIIEVFLCFLSMTDKYIYELKSKLDKGKFNRKLKKVVKTIRVKLNIFYAFTFLFFLGYWYIISVFCAVYRNTQLIFLKDSVYSFGMGLVYPLFLYFFSVIFRICSLRDKKKNSKCLYKFSGVIPLF